MRAMLTGGSDTACRGRDRHSTRRLMTRCRSLREIPVRHSAEPRAMWLGNKKTPAAGLLLLSGSKMRPATSYSPTESPRQYHPRCET
jgi:hypothetical protein